MLFLYIFDKVLIVPVIMASEKRCFQKSILIVDNEFDIVTLIKRALQKYGFNTLAFTDPLLAFEHQ